MVPLCAIQEKVPSSISLRFLIVSLLSVCRTPGNSFERNPSLVDVTTLYLRSWLMLRNCPFLLHEIRGCGIPSAVQLNVTVPSSVGDLVTFVPLVYNSCAGTILTKTKITIIVASQTKHFQPNITYPIHLTELIQYYYQLGC